MIETKEYFSSAIENFASRPVIADHLGIKFNYSSIGSIVETGFFKDLYREVVLCRLTNDPECLALYFSLLCSGAIPILTSFDLDDISYNQLKAVYKPNAELVLFEELDATDLYFTNNLIKKFTIRKNFEKDINYKVHPDLSLMFSTSGSTGSLKYVRISHKNIISNTEEIKNYLNIQKSDSVITTLPPSYTYGASVLHTHFVSGGLITCTQSSLFQNDFWQLMQKFNITTFNGVPFHYQMLHRLKFHNRSLPYLRCFTQAGGHMPAPLKKFFIDYCSARSLDFYVMYGQTEASPRISYANLQSLAEKPETIGRGILGCELTLEDERGARIKEPYKTGELVVEGDNVSLGYAYSFQDLGNDDKFNKRLRTGDLSYFDEDGCFYIEGRKSRFIKIIGRRMNLDDIQNMISELGIENVCVGTDDLLKVGCVGLSPEGEKKIITQLMERLNLPKSSINIFNLDKIDKTISGKIAYAENDKNMVIP